MYLFKCFTLTKLNKMVKLLLQLADCKIVSLYKFKLDTVNCIDFHKHMFLLDNLIGFYFMYY